MRKPEIVSSYTSVKFGFEIGLNLWENCYNGEKPYTVYFHIDIIFWEFWLYI